jgi:hypothetical protein
MTAAAAAARAFILEELHGCAALGARHLENRVCLPVPSVLAGTLHGSSSPKKKGTAIRITKREREKNHERPVGWGSLRSTHPTRYPYRSAVRSRNYLRYTPFGGNLQVAGLFVAPTREAGSTKLPGEYSLEFMPIRQAFSLSSTSAVSLAGVEKKTCRAAGHFQLTKTSERRKMKRFGYIDW